MAVRQPVAEESVLPSSIPENAEKFCKKHGLSGALETALTHIRKCFTGLQKVEFEVIEDPDFESLSMIVTAHAD